MPKKPSRSVWNNRGGRPSGSDDRHYFGHDDRTGRDFMGNRPRVSFKPQVRPTRDPSRNLNLALDDDISMTIASNNNSRQVVVRGGGRGIPRGGRNSPLPQRRMRGRQIPKLRTSLDIANWYKITIPYGHKYEKNYILNTLMSYIQPDTFIPIMYKVIGNEAIFYVDDHSTASKLMECDRKITTAEGFKLSVQVRPGCPPCEFDNELKEKMKQAMAKRYVQETNALDLSKFHQDPDLAPEYFCALYRPVMLMTVLDIVSEHIPTLEALNLEGNKLFSIERLSVLGKKFPKLKILYIGDNKIKDMRQLEVMKDTKLEELRLAGNPVCHKYKTRPNDYISDVRKWLPKLLRLDGQELPRPILFDVADEGAKLPPTKKMFVANTNAQEIASQFLYQYFIIYDSDNRQPLLDAYHDHAFFSLTITYNNNSNKLSAYLPENRNLFRTVDEIKRRKLLKQGRLPVVSFISELPKTSHYLNSFTMDISLVTEGMMLIIVTGLFKELGGKEELNRYFNRTFIIVPEGSGYCILNEQLHISQPTEMQEKYLKNSASRATVSEAAATPGTSAAVPSSSEIPADVKQQMTVTLSQQTNMNLEWSLKCLQEVQWNYENALAAFQEFFKLGQIPPEAFTK